MSSTNRGGERRDDDYYPTPAWAVDRFLDDHGERLLSLGRRWLEPAVGDGAIVRAVHDWCVGRGLEPPTWVTCDVRPGCPSAVGHSAEGRVERSGCGDFTWFGGAGFDPGRVDVAITNPPFLHASAFAARCLEVASATALLLRVGWLGSDKRARWLREHTPSMHVLPDRPSFDGRGQDSDFYGWFSWGLFPAPTLGVLATTPEEVRARHKLISRRTLGRAGRR